VHTPFEQLCINYCNEKLQQFFLFTVLVNEKVEHEREGVPLGHVDIPDNQPVIELIEKPPLGLFAMLDSQVTLA
jgi:myosin heavy subunit